MVMTADKNTTEQVFYPSGYIDFAIKVSGSVVTIINGRPIDMPKVEVLGQLTVPTRLTVTKGTVILIAKIFPFANALFLSGPASAVTNDSIDLHGLIGKESNEFHYKLMEARTKEQQVKALDNFLVRQLEKNQGLLSRVTFIKQMCHHILSEGDLFNIQTLSAKYGFSERYIQKLFLDNVGVPPSTFFQLQRFNKSLDLINGSDLSLTSIAYDCGYYDQAHFIREFKRFTGVTPSAIRAIHTAE
jgi:AraC-like DNA-binding protein